jgi:DNA-binding NarL/FixJ family response regulator
MGQEIRILLVHGQRLFRESLGRLLRDEPDFQIVGSCASVREAIGALEREAADIVLVDYDLGEEQRLDFLEGAKRVGFEGRILITTTPMSGGAVLRALEWGTSGIVMRHSPPSELVKAIRQVANGELWLDPETVKAMAEAVRSGEHRAWQPLSARECAVLKSVLEGLTNRQIAAKLQIPESSVKYVIRRLFEKAGVKRRSQLVRIALERQSRDWLPAL